MMTGLMTGGNPIYLKIYGNPHVERWMFHKIKHPDHPGTWTAPHCRGILACDAKNPWFISWKIPSKMMKQVDDDWG